jgi:tRNA-dihydrouridine synthase
MRRHYTNYFKGYRGIKEYRSRLVTTMDPKELFNILDEIEHVYANEASLV